MNASSEWIEIQAHHLPPSPPSTTTLVLPSTSNPSSIASALSLTLSSTPHSPPPSSIIIVSPAASACLTPTPHPPISLEDEIQLISSLFPILQPRYAQWRNSQQGRILFLLSSSTLSSATGTPLPSPSTTKAPVEGHEGLIVDFALHGLFRTLSLEGETKNVLTNIIALPPSCTAHQIHPTLPELVSSLTSPTSRDASTAFAFHPDTHALSIGVWERANGTPLVALSPLPVDLETLASTMADQGLDFSSDSLISESMDDSFRQVMTLLHQSSSSSSSSPLSLAPSAHLAGTQALVTGAGRGLGLAYAHALADQGADIILNDLDPTLLSQTAQDLATGVTLAPGSVTDPDLDSWLPPDNIQILVNNAGYLRDKSFHKMTHESWTAMIDIHLRAPLRITQACAARAAASAPTSPLAVVNISSAAGLVGNYGQANYGCAKSGVVGLTLALARGAVPGVTSATVFAPVATTRLTLSMFPPSIRDSLAPPGAAVFIPSLSSPSLNGTVWEGGAGWTGGVRFSLTSPLLSSKL